MYRTLILRLWPLFLALFLGAGVFLGLRLNRLTVDAGTNMLLNEDDPDLAFYNKSRADWEYDEYTIVCVRNGNWFSREGIELLNQFTVALARLPHVEKVTAINTVPLLRNPKSADKEGYPDLRRPGVDLGKAREELLTHTQAVGNLISPDGKDLSILVYLKVSDDVRRLEPRWNSLHGRPDDPEAKKEIENIRGDYEEALRTLRTQRTAQVRAIRALCREWGPKFAEPIRLSGLPIIYINMVEHIESDLRNFGLAAGAMFVLGFSVVFRKIRWTVLPILTCLLPVVIVLGTMVLLGRRMTVITSNMPILLFILMLPYTVYFVERYRERRSRDPGEDPRTTVTGAARDIWVPCLYSAMTTMAGTASLLTSGISPVRTFGLTMTIGMALGLAAAFLFLPSGARPLRGLIVKPPRTRGPLHLLAGIPLRAPRLVLLGSLAILGVAIWGTTKLDVETKFIDYFQKKSEVYAGLEYIDTRMGGTTPLEVILRSNERGYFRSAKGLKAIAAAQKFFNPRTRPEVGNVRSLRSLLDEVRKSAPGIVPDALILNKLQEKSPGLVREFCNEDFTVARVLVRMRETATTLNRKKVLEALRTHLAGEPALAELAEKRPTGVFVLYSNMLQSLLKSQKDTFAMVLAAIYVMLVILFRSPILAFLTLLPQILPVFVVLGTMGFAKIPLDMVTTMIASVALGVGIDPAIQYVVRFRRELTAGGDHAEVVARTHASIGRAIAIGGAIVFSGFSVLVLSKFVPTVYFGVFTGLAVLIGILAALTTLPAAFVLLKYPKK